MQNSPQPEKKAFKKHPLQRIFQEIEDKISLLDVTQNSTTQPAKQTQAP